MIFSMKPKTPVRIVFRMAVLLMSAAGILTPLAQANITGINDHPATAVATQLNTAIAEGDVETLKSLIAPDVMIFESGGAESSLVEYESHHLPADIEFMKNMNRTVTSQHFIDAGDSAIVMTQSTLVGVYKEKEYNLSETLVLENIAGHWKVVHIHWSSR